MSMATAVFVGMGAVVSYGLGALLLAALGAKKRHHELGRATDGHKV